MPKDVVCQHVRRITPYSPGKFSKEVMEELGITEVIKLASNENPLGPGPLALAAAQANVVSVVDAPTAGVPERTQVLVADPTAVEPETLDQLDVLVGAGAGLDELEGLLGRLRALVHSG